MDENTVTKNFELDASNRLYMLNRYKLGNVRKFFLKIYDTTT